MKNLKKLSKILLIMSMVLVFASCKKDKDEAENGASMGTLEYQGKSLKITTADYREGNGDGAWIYLTTGDFNTVQIRFKNLGNYVIPTGTFTYKSGLPYSTANNFPGGMISISNVVDEINGGTVAISKSGETYTITFNATTAKGTIKGEFKGSLKRI